MFVNLPNVTHLLYSVYLSDKATLFVWEKSYYCKAMCYMIHFVILMYLSRSLTKLTVDCEPGEDSDQPVVHSV